MTDRRIRHLRKIHLLFRTACLAALALYMVTPIFARGPDRGWPLGTGIGLMGGYAKPSPGLHSGGAAFGFCLSLGFMEYLAIEITGQYFGPEVKPSEDGLSKGKLAIIPVQLNLQVRLPLGGGRCRPYLEAGGGYFLNRFTLDSGIAEGWENVGFVMEEKVENSLGFHFGAGLDFYVIRNISLGLCIKYCLTKMNGSWRLADTASSTVASADLSGLTLNPLIAGLRIRYIFK